MLDPIEHLITRALCVPPQPEPPFGAPGSLAVFRASKQFLQYRVLSWLPRQLGYALTLVFIYVTSHGDMPDLFRRFQVLSKIEEGLSQQIQFFSIADSVVLFIFLIQLPFSFLIVVLDYEYRWYMITDRSLRIREGIWRVREQTMTFSNIQNVEVRLGPVQRFFGIADLEVRTAGGGSMGAQAGQADSDSGNLHIGYFRGLSDAQEVCDALMDRLRMVAGTGLGDPDDAREGPRGSGIDNEDLAASARILAGEARALTETLRRRDGV